MGGLWNTIPDTSRPFLIATLAIAGIFPFAGFFSKDEILGHAFHRSQMMDRYLALWLVGLITAGMTAYYMFRLLFLTFFGLSRVSPELEEHIHESPKTMTVPLMILAFLSISGGWFALPVLWGEKNTFGMFLEPVLGGVETETGSVQLGQHTLFKEYFLMILSLAVVGMGLWLAYQQFLKNPKLHDKFATSFPRLHNLLVHKYYVDEIYDALFVNRIEDLSTALGWVDAHVIDGLGVDGAGWLTRLFSRISIWWDKWIVDGLVNLVGKFTEGLSVPVRMFQTGVFSSYAMWILVGVVILLGYYGHHMQVWLRNLR
jgi:NADH-quinone oxidoreductase subunit L